MRHLLFTLFLMGGVIGYIPALFAEDLQLDLTTPFGQKIVEYGFSTSSTLDLSNSNKIEISEPNIAIVNISGVNTMPTSKTENSQAWLECYDGNGHYFKKKVFLNAQGKGSMQFVKKNFAADFLEDNWEGNNTTDITIGDWVSQDAFHFKAFYTDYFRGIGIVNYKLFTDIIADQSTYQERAGLADYNTKAMCYPDGFPCLVYLNGDFYGIFAWQLKKHRKNMDQTKNNPAHIHLDGTLGSSSIWRGNINWTLFEIRNPKTLYTTDTREVTGFKYVEITDNEDEITAMGDQWVLTEENPKDMDNSLLTAESTLYYKYITSKGKIKYYKLTDISGIEYVEYDGDNPKELIDENCEYYDPNNSGHVLTAQVKNYIQTASMYWGELKVMKDAGTSADAMKAAISARFDVPGIIDYIIFNVVISNYDAFNNNWQWFTYDGVKWFVAPYDVDQAYGKFYYGEQVMPANWSFYDDNYTLTNRMTQGPSHWVRLYFGDEISARYNTLRNSGILTTDNIMNYIYDWYNRVGEENYALEWSKWPDSYCIHDLEINNNWTTVEDWTGYSAIENYNPNTTYNEGDKCKDAYRIWIAKNTVTGVKPYNRIGHYDSASRTRMWISERLNLEDTNFQHAISEQDSYNLVISSVGQATLCVPFTFDIPVGVHLYTVTGVDENNQLIKTEVTTPIANKPYLVIGDPGTYTISGTYDEGDISDDGYMANGLLWGTYKNVYVPQGGYVLQAKDNGGASFALVTKNNYIALGANKAYLEIPALGRAKARSVEHDAADETTSIDELKPAEIYNDIDAIFNLSGTPMRQSQKGVNIIRYKNGETKKVTY